MIVRVAPVEHYRWIAERANLRIGSDFHALEAVDSEGRIHGMVGYDGWTPNGVCIHLALGNPASLRAMIKPALEIPFLQFGLGVIVATILSNNARSLRLAERMGFVRAGVVHDAWAPGVDLVFHELRRKDCGWIERKAA